MMSKAAISVVIPAYNEAAFIGQCLESLSQQSLKPLEIIVVDNNSIDQTAQIAARYPLVRVIKESQQGIVYARNAGFNAARGQIIARCDADTILPPNWLLSIAINFEHHHIDAVTGPCVFYDLPKQFRNLKTSLKQSHILLYFKGSKAMLGHETLFGSNMALTKSIWDRVKSQVCHNEAKMHEDTDLSIHIAAVGGQIRFDPKLQASISVRRAMTSLPELIAYVGRWPKTRLLHPPIKRQDHEA